MKHQQSPSPNRDGALLDPAVPPSLIFLPANCEVRQHFSSRFPQIPSSPSPVNREGHGGCVNAVAWNSRGLLLISGSDDAHMNIWSYSGQKLLQSIDTRHSTNIFCTKFIPETSDELVASGAGDAEVRLFNRSRISGNGLNDNAVVPSALYQCHTRRVKKLAVENGNPNVVWSASEDGTVRQHDLREGTSCPPAGCSHQECRNVLRECGASRKHSCR